MANAFIKPPVIINTVLGMLQDELVLPHFIWKDGFGDFHGKYNDTITIRIPRPSVAHTRKLRAVGADRNMIASDLDETAIDIKLTDVIYSLINLTDEERELDLRSFGTDVLPRQVRAVSEQIEYGVSHTIQTAPYQKVHGAAEDGIYNSVIKARRQLNDDHVPREGRTLLAGSAIEEALLLDDRFIRYDSAGQEGANRLTNATIGRIGGYDVVVVDTIPHGAAYLFHDTAYAMVTRAPGRPMTNAVATSVVASENGVQLRWLGDYDSSATTDRSIVDGWAGYKAIVDPDYGFVRAARIQLKATDAELSGGTGLKVGDGPAPLVLMDSNEDDRAGDPSVTWTSSAPTKVAVDADGNVTALGAGTATITAVVDGVTKTLDVTATA